MLLATFVESAWLYRHLDVLHFSFCFHSHLRKEWTHLLIQLDLSYCHSNSFPMLISHHQNMLPKPNASASLQHIQRLSLCHHNIAHVLQFSFHLIFVRRPNTVQSDLNIKMDHAISYLSEVAQLVLNCNSRFLFWVLWMYIFY